ncbi:MAG: hypothetical protein KF812_04895 [Fimbriimonadaceae bacterium]|nr:hypothetical protein [Fimbriimonadaceae bacterium]
MVFRRIYWVTEQLDAKGCGVVTGVYTSIPDLMNKGLRWLNGQESAKLRVSLIKLDSPGQPLGCWTGPEFENFETDLEQCIVTKEFTPQEVETLAGAIRKFAESS